MTTSEKYVNCGRGIIESMVDDIRDFHEKFELQYDGSPRMLESALAQFRIKFMQEELNEYIEAYRLLVQKQETTAGCMMIALDSLVDLVYVALGTAYLHGFDFNEAWRRVHEANMKKVRVTHAKESKRLSDYDVVKPEGWVAPDLSDLV